MREILFRAKRKNGNGEWLYGDLLHDYWVHGDTVMPCAIRYKINSSYSFPIEVIPETVGQFTGLTDKNGREIFEGDKFGNENMPVRHVVFEDGKFCFNRVHSQGADALSQDRVGRLEIIGNIHDKPELIKQGGVK